MMIKSRFLGSALFLYLAFVFAPHAMAKDSLSTWKPDNLTYHREMIDSDMCAIVSNDNPNNRIVYSHITLLGSTVFKEDDKVFVITRNGHFESIQGDQVSNDERLRFLSMIPDIHKFCSDLSS